MKVSLTAVVFLSALVLLTPALAQEDSDLPAVRWGMTVEQVMLTEKAQNPRESESGLRYRTSVRGHPADLYYYFEGGRLVGAILYIGNFDDALLKTIQDNMRNNFGKPLVLDGGRIYHRSDTVAELHEDKSVLTLIFSDSSNYERGPRSFSEQEADRLDYAARSFGSY